MKDSPADRPCHGGSACLAPYGKGAEHLVLAP